MAWFSFNTRDGTSNNYTICPAAEYSYFMYQSSSVTLLFLQYLKGYSNSLTFMMVGVGWWLKRISAHSFGGGGGEENDGGGGRGMVCIIVVVASW